MLDRRQLLFGAGLSALLPSACTLRPRLGGAPAVLLNDVHSRLNPTEVAEVVPVDSLATMRRALRRAERHGRAISVAGGRHAMGGQQFADGAIHLDMGPLARVLDFDREEGTIEVEAGIQWPALVAHYLAAQQDGGPQWAIAQKQTGADRLSIGGALAANAHGRGLTMPPIVADVESFTLLDASGELRTCSREQDAELFSLAIGGYGLFGPIYSVRLRLVPRRKLERVVALRSTEGLIEAFDEQIAAGALYGDFQFSIDTAEDSFLRDGVFSCYRPADPDAPLPEGQRELADREWAELLYLAHADEAEAFRQYSRYYLSTSGQVYWNDSQQMGFYADDYHGALDERLGATAPGSEMITELYVPRGELTGFLAAAASWLRDNRSEVVYGTVRLIERDEDSFLAWARQPWACTVMNLHVEHSAEGIERAKRELRGLIDLAAERGGSYFLTYHRWA
ncbi:MAG TPA: FAD-binding oxidoreductase, partial [Thermoanaerobaculia bacterium]|nr:FAD-binding oxidoreductase [Thermoanaerobaculia bacterium]